MAEKILCPSIMCANFSNLEGEIKALDSAGIDIFHIDIMDGSFVPNFAMGLQDFECIRSMTDKLIDVHLMIKNPGRYVEIFADKGADIIYIHPESENNVARTLEKIKVKGKKAGIALNPGTSVSSIKELLNIADYVMVMTVNPGFSGQKFLNYTISKIEELAKLSGKYNFKLMVDGAISSQKVKSLSKIGVNGFILGTSSLFNKEEPYREIIKKLR